MIKQLKPDEIFVFGSNLAGRHGAGAAKQARVQFGAQYGVGEGLTGQCYAFPTLTRTLGKRTMLDLRKSRTELYATCRETPDKQFLLTKVGCGLAGYAEEDMKELFANPPKNLILPKDWSE